MTLPALPWWRRPVRHLRRMVLLIPSLVVFSGAALLAWLLLTESGLAGAARVLAWTSADRVRVEGVGGRLLGPLSIRQIEVRSGEDRYVIDDFALRWNPMSLFDGPLEVEAITAGRVMLAPAGGDPAALPASLRLPFAVRIAHLEIARLEWQEAPSRLLASAVTGVFSSDGEHHLLESLSMDVDGGRLDFKGTLAGKPPFLLRAEAALAGNTAPPLAIGARINGTLESLSIDFDGRGADFSLAGRAGIRPFVAYPLAALRMTARGLDPQAFLASAPRARLALDVDLAEEGSGALAGYLRADNAAPAPIDRKGLPFSRAEATLHFQWATLPRQLRMDELLLRLGDQGSIRGRLDLSWPDTSPMPSGEAELMVRRLNPAHLHSAFHNFRLDGQISLTSDGEAQQARMALADGPRRLDAELIRRGDSVALKGLRLGHGAAELAGSGEISLDAGRAWQFSGRLRHFDPAVFASVPRADLNGSVEASGQWQPELGGSMRFVLARSELAGEALSGSGDLRFSGLDRPADLIAANGKAQLGGQIELQWGATRLQLQGGWGRPTERLMLSLKAPDLSRHRALAPTLQGALDLSLEGTAARHRLRARGALAAGRQFDVQAEGGLQAARSWRDASWQGKLDTLSLQGDLALALNAPAQLTAGRQRVLLGPAQLALAGGRVDVDELAWQPGRWSSRGRFSGLGLRPGTEKGRQRNPLRIGGDWSLAGTSGLDGSFRAFRESGDWLLPGTLPPSQRLAGLKTLRFEALGKGRQLALDLRVDGSRVGRWQANALLPLSSALALPDRIQEGSLKASVDDLSWLGPTFNANLTSAGSLEADIRFSGRLAEPQIEGQLRGQQLALALLDENVQLRDGELSLRLDQEKAVLERLVFTAPHAPPAAPARLAGFSVSEAGRLTLNGEFDMSRNTLALQGEATRLPLSQRAERWLVVSGKFSLAQRGESLREGVRLDAGLRADAGFIAEALAAAPRLADDIVVLGQTPAERRGLPVESEISFDLGEHFHLRAAGLTSRLLGQLRLRGGLGGGGERLVANGSIATRDGIFEAYGQRLSVERGIVNFQGPLDDPGLNVLALRKGGAVEAGVTVTGTAQRPVVRLVSTPPVPDSEKLSWIVLGRPSNAGGTDAAVLLAAAGDILGGSGGSVTAQLAQALGVDEISLRQAPGADPLSGQIVVLGKRLSARTHLGYEQGLSAASGAVKLTHSLTPRISVVTRAGEDSAIDVFYNFSFD